MVDTPRTIAYLQATSFPTNGIGGITAQNSRDLVATLDCLTSTVSVKQYGAVGDGATNDTTAFNNAIASGASVILVPASASPYIVSAVAMNQANQTLRLARGATLKAVAGMGGGGRVIAISANGVTIMGEGTIDGNRANVTDSSGIYSSSGTTDITIEGITLTGFVSNAIQLNNPTRCIVRSTDIRDHLHAGIYFLLDSGAAAACVDNSVLTNYVDGSAIIVGTGFAAITVQALVGATFGYLNTVIQGNTVRGPTSSAAAGDADCIIHGGYSTAATAVNSAITGNVTYGGHMGISVAFGSNVSIVGNAIYTAWEVGIECPACNDSVVANNCIDGAGVLPNGINLDKYTGTCSGMVVSGNKINNVTAFGIVSFSATHFVLSGNIITITGASAVGINLCAPVDFSVVGGSIDCGTTSPTAINFDSSTYADTASAHDGVVCGVHMSRYASRGIFFASSKTGNAIDNITVSGCEFRSTVTPLDHFLANGATIGNNVQIIGCAGIVGKQVTSNGNARRSNILDYTNSVQDIIGSGAPGSSVTAGPGSTYRNQAGGTTTTFYVKESGTGTTVWVAK